MRLFVHRLCFIIGTVIVGLGKMFLRVAEVFSDFEESKLDLKELTGAEEPAIKIPLYCEDDLV